MTRLQIANKIVEIAGILFMMTFLKEFVVSCFNDIGTNTDIKREITTSANVIIATRAGGAMLLRRAYKTTPTREKPRIYIIISFTFFTFSSLYIILPCI